MRNIREEREIYQAIIPAAGLGTRFFPVTHTLPKELLPVYDRPALQVVLEEAKGAGIRTVSIVTSDEKPQLTQHFERNPIAGLEITFVTQEAPLGLGHAIHCGVSAFSSVGEAFAVLLPDQIFFDEGRTLIGLREVFQSTGLSALAIERVLDTEVSRYGILEGDAYEQGEGEILKAKRLLEKPTPAETTSRWAMPGRYVLSKHILPYLETLTPGTKGELQLTDALDQLARHEGLLGIETHAPVFDTGNPQGLLEASLYRFWQQDPEGVQDLIARSEYLEGVRTC